MAANLLLVAVAGCVSVVLSAAHVLLGSGVSVRLLAIAFAWGAFLGLVALRWHGSAAEVWRRLRRPPGTP